jgi:hypothetical protein
MAWICNEAYATVSGSILSTKKENRQDCTLAVVGRNCTAGFENVKIEIHRKSKELDDRKFLMRYQSKIAPFFNVGI